MLSLGVCSNLSQQQEQMIRMPCPLVGGVGQRLQPKPRPCIPRDSARSPRKATRLSWVQSWREGGPCLTQAKLVYSTPPIWH